MTNLQTFPVGYDVVNSNTFEPGHSLHCHLNPMGVDACYIAGSYFFTLIPASRSSDADAVTDANASGVGFENKGNCC